METDIGFIGLGIMGRPMALNLLRAGHRLRVYARRAPSMQPLLDAGAVACDSPRALAAQVDVVITMVSDTPDVEQLVRGADGIVHGARPGTVVVDMSTISPAATRQLAAELSARQVDMLDAPVSGGEIGAVEASLSIMVGGKPDVFARARPLLASMGKNIVHIGDHGAGQVAKACNQIVVAVTIEAVSEALTFARRQGVDAAKVRAALLGGFAASRVLDVHGQRMLERQFKAGFKTRLHGKDLNIVLDEALHLGLDLPATALLARHLAALVAQGDGDLDSSAIVKIIERLGATAH